MKSEETQANEERANIYSASWKRNCENRNNKNQKQRSLIITERGNSIETATCLSEGDCIHSSSEHSNTQLSRSYSVDMISSYNALPIGSVKKLVELHETIVNESTRCGAMVSDNVESKESSSKMTSKSNKNDFETSFNPINRSSSASSRPFSQISLTNSEVNLLDSAVSTKSKKRGLLVARYYIDNIISSLSAHEPSEFQPKRIEEKTDTKNNYSESSPSNPQTKFYRATSYSSFTSSMISEDNIEISDSSNFNTNIIPSTIQSSHLIQLENQTSLSNLNRYSIGIENKPVENQNYCRQLLGTGVNNKSGVENQSYSISVRRSDSDDELNTANKIPKTPRAHFQLQRPNQIRAFGYRALSFQKRQWFTNICCITFCPVLIILISFALQTIIQILLTKGIDNQSQVLYCSKENSLNEQLWPAFTEKSLAIKKTPSESYAGATKTIINFNFLQRSIFFDLNSAESLNLYSAMSLYGSAPCKFYLSH